jgi:hypothetical protein
VPIRVTILNQGGSPADTFKVSTSVSTGSDSSLVRFSVPGSDSDWHPSTSAPLAAGAEVSFDGVVTILDDLQGQTVSLRALADSCAGDEVMPEYCRVQESNEDNNESSPVSVSLPAMDITGPLISSISLDPPEPTTEDVITVEAIVEDESGVAQAVLWYRRAFGGWSTAPMDPIGGDKYRTQIGPLWKGSLYYLVKAQDTGGYESESVELSATVTVPGPD